MTDEEKREEIRKRLEENSSSYDVTGILQGIGEVSGQVLDLIFQIVTAVFDA